MEIKDLIVLATGAIAGAVLHYKYAEYHTPAASAALPARRGSGASTSTSKPTSRELRMLKEGKFY
jgi:hypothetical protein